MNSTSRESVYDRLRPYLDADDILRRLGITPSRRSGAEAYCAPLCHKSSSGESLQVNLQTGRWNCKACQSAGYRGDLYQLVEYVLTGGAVPSHGTAQGSSPTHREAVEWLCGQFAVPMDDGLHRSDGALELVHAFAMLAHRWLLSDDGAGVREWIAGKWGFDRPTVEQYGIGYMPDPILPELAREALANPAAFRASGLGFFPPGGGWRTRFAGRVLFPYLEHGRAVYLIGRATPWTPALEPGRAAPKYHKLTVHSETRPAISPEITNDHLWNEPVMGSAPSVVVAEGVADAVALSSLGVPVVSPVTISFNAADLERFTRKAAEVDLSHVEILFDNELSGSGGWGARRTARKLAEAGLTARVLALPLGPDQQAARHEVEAALGAEGFAAFERATPRDRKLQLEALFAADPARLAWVLEQVERSKIDAAEWCAAEGAGAPGRFDGIRRAGRDVVELEAAEVEVDPDDDPSLRVAAFAEVIALAAANRDRLAREGYAGVIAAAAGRGVTKAEVGRRIAQERRKAKEASEVAESENAQQERAAAVQALALPPPEFAHNTPPAPATAPPPPGPPGAASTSDAPGAPPAPPAPGAGSESSDPAKRYQATREGLQQAMKAGAADETLGRFVSEIFTRSAGYTAFRTPEDLILVRGSERCPVGLGRYSEAFRAVLWQLSGLSPRKTKHVGVIESAVQLLSLGARKAEDVSWAYVDERRDVYIATGDAQGTVVQVAPGEVTRHRMAEIRVPAVPGEDFLPFDYTDSDGGIEQAYQALSWTSLSPGDRLVLLYWLVCLPVLRRIGTVPIVRVEGGSGSGKTRTIEAVSWLVNGRQGSSVPTTPALVSRLSRQMLTVDDNREAGDVTPAFLATLLQATQLGAREKRRQGSDTATIVERVAGALLMTGVEPVHGGRPELASRMLTLRCEPVYRDPSSPVSPAALQQAALGARDAFWSEALRRSAGALALDVEHGERLGAEIEAIFGASRIGRLSGFLRVCYLAWVDGHREPGPRAAALESIAPVWRDALGNLGRAAIDSLIREELVVTSVRYAFAFGRQEATNPAGGFSGYGWRHAFDGAFAWNPDSGEATLGPMRASRLARIVRTAARTLNGPRPVTYDLTSGQLEARLVDGAEYLAAAGYGMGIERTAGGRLRFTFWHTLEKIDPSQQEPDPLG